MKAPDRLLEAQLDADALARYERALEDAANVRDAWEKAGRMLTIMLPNQCEIASPLWKVLQAAEAHAARMGRELRGPARPDRRSFEETSLLAESPDLAKSPAVRLRLAGEERPNRLVEPLCRETK